MPWNVDQAETDYEDYQLDEFGETVSYVPSGGTQKDIQACVYRTEAKQLPLSNSRTRPGKTKLVIRISQDATKGISRPLEHADKVKIRMRHNDVSVSTLRVQLIQDEYGTWLLGLM